MSRDLRFRAWDNERHRYVGDCVIEFKTYGPETSVVVCPNSQEYAYDSCHDYYKDGRFIVEQFTGLKDKNGKEIYEGDIVNVIGIGIAQVIDSPIGEWMLYYRREPNEINSGFASVVPKNKPSGLWKTNTTSYIEVIGNIHENPELLEGEK